MPDWVDAAASATSPAGLEMGSANSPLPDELPDEPALPLDGCANAGAAGNRTAQLSAATAATR